MCGYLSAGLDAAITSWSEGGSTYLHSEGPMLAARTLHRRKLLFIGLASYRMIKEEHT